MTDPSLWEIIDHIAYKCNDDMEIYIIEISQRPYKDGWLVKTELWKKEPHFHRWPPMWQWLANDKDKMIESLVDVDIIFVRSPSNVRSISTGFYSKDAA